MERDGVLNMRLPSKTKAALAKAAADDRRTVSAFVEIVLEDWLADRGYLERRRPPLRRGKVVR